MDTRRAVQIAAGALIGWCCVWAFPALLFAVGTP